jgi:uncharacterized protein
MPQMTFLQLAQKVLGEEKTPLTPEEIWKTAQTKGYDKAVGSQGKTPWRTIGAQLYVEVRDNPASIFTKTDTRPKRFLLKSLVETQGQKILESSPPPALIENKPGYWEKDLHPYLVYYGFHYLKAHLRTIHHNKSKKDEFGEWVHPDIVGCYFPFGDWKDEVVEASLSMGYSAVRLFSFELKKQLSFSNLREAFFQAVSNSSWANEGYLAAASISSDEDFNSELERLSTSFGIGVIRIDVEDPDSTTILFPARPKDTVDWEMVNKLSFNPDFRDFLKRIKIDVGSREVRKELYDSILAKDELLKLIATSKG